jgi:uncharacterized protein YjbI with pentapeptide repeats
MVWATVGNFFRTTDERLRHSEPLKAVVRIAAILGKLTIFFGILSFLVEAPERAKQRHYQAWQLIDGARGHPGDAGRSIAFEVLVGDHQMMRDLDLTNANLQGRDLRSAIMPGVLFKNSKLIDVDFSCKRGVRLGDYWIPEFQWCSDLQEAQFQTDKITGVKFNGASLIGAVFGGVSDNTQRPVPTTLSNSHFDEADMQGVSFNTTLLLNNTFKGTKNMKGIIWGQSAIKGDNSFVGADLSGARWHDIRIEVDAGQKPSDFTDANLSDIQLSAQPVPAVPTTADFGQIDT